MRGTREPKFEHDFPPGSDIVGDILRGPKAGERMEFELFSRLGTQMELFPSKVGVQGGITLVRIRGEFGAAFYSSWLVRVPHPPAFSKETVVEFAFRPVAI